MEIIDGHIIDNETALEDIYEAYCCRKAAHETLTVQEFIESFKKDNSPHAKHLKRSYTVFSNLEDEDPAKVNKLMKMQLIKRECYKPKELSEWYQEKLVERTQKVNEQQMKALCLMYDKSVFIEPSKYFKSVKLSFAQLIQCHIDMSNKRDIFFSSGTKQANLTLKTFLMSFYGLDEKDLEINYDELILDVLRDREEIPSELRLREGDESNNSEFVMKLITACDRFDFTMIKNLVAESDDLNIEYNGRHFTKYIRDKYEETVGSLSSISIEELGLYTALLYLYGSIIDILYTRLEQIANNRALNDPDLVYITNKSSMINKYDLNFKLFDDLSNFFSLFNHVKLPEHFILDAFCRKNNRTGIKDLWLYVRDSRIKEPWDKKSEYVFGTEVENSISKNKSKMVPSLYKTLEVPFDEKGLWEAFLIWFIPNIDQDILNMKTNEPYYSAFSIEAVNNAVRKLGYFTEDILPKLRFIDNDTAEISALMYIYGETKLYERWSWTIHREGKHIRFEKEKIREL